MTEQHGWTAVHVEQLRNERPLAPDLAEQLAGLDDRALARTVHADQHGRIGEIEDEIIDAPHPVDLEARYSQVRHEITVPPAAAESRSRLGAGPLPWVDAGPLARRARR